MSKKYVILIDGIPCIENEKGGYDTVLGSGTEWECQEIVDQFISEHQIEFETLNKNLEEIARVIGKDLNSFTAPGVRIIGDLIKKVGEELFKKVIVSSLYDKAVSGTDGRLTPSTCEFIKKLAKTYPVIRKYRVYEHPYLWNEAVQAYIKCCHKICPLGGVYEDDCETCSYSGDYHYVDGQCVKRE